MTLNDHLPYVNLYFKVVMLLSALIAGIAMTWLFRSYRKQLWLVPFVGIILFLLGTCLDLLNEFYRFPLYVSVLELCFKGLGNTIFSLGLLAVVVRRLIKMADFDPLTEIYNRRYLMEAFAKERERCKRYRLKLALVFIDIDHFKTINDTLGHTAGDVALKSLSQLLKSKTRSTDLLARYGGDEFVILMPHSDRVQAVSLVERLNREVQSLVLANGSPLTVSFGIAEYPDDGLAFEDLVKIASRAMHQHKVDKAQQLTTVIEALAPGIS